MNTFARLGSGEAMKGCQYCKGKKETFHDRWLGRDIKASITGNDSLCVISHATGSNIEMYRCYVRIFHCPWCGEKL